MYIVFGRLLLAFPRLYIDLNQLCLYFYSNLAASELQFILPMLDLLTYHVISGHLGERSTRVLEASPCVQGSSIPTTTEGVQVYTWQILV